jgi:predicted transcriptional regulator of viral defense system
MYVTDIVTSVRSTLERLGGLADGHGGYFTTAEAAEAGLSRRLLSHHATAGTLERVDHGVYRLRLYPSSRLEDLIVAALWAGPDAAISHESALVVHGLGEAMPAVVHVTVPRPFRGKRPGVVIHHRPLDEGDRVVVDAVPVTSVERTLADVAESSDPALVRAAAGEALDRGQTTRRRLERVVTDPAARALLLGDT